MTRLVGSDTRIGISEDDFVVFGCPYCGTRELPTKLQIFPNKCTFVRCANQHNFLVYLGPSGITTDTQRRERGYVYKLISHPMRIRKKVRMLGIVGRTLSVAAIFVALVSMFVTYSSPDMSFTSSVILTGVVLTFGAAVLVLVRKIYGKRETTLRELEELQRLM